MVAVFEWELLEAPTTEGESQAFSGYDPRGDEVRRERKRIVKGRYYCWTFSSFLGVLCVRGRPAFCIRVYYGSPSPLS